MVVNRRRIVAAMFTCVALGAMPFPAAQAQEKFITVASTTSTEQSGLFPHLLPRFEQKTGIKVHVVALGTGQALDLARRGDADVAFVHARSAEDKFLAEGYGVKRFPVMYNDFVLVGPKSDPAKVAGDKDILDALKKVQSSAAPFVSRGDRSGTHIAELDLWKSAGIDIEKAKGPWYRDTGQGMGPALNTASSMNAYILTDRGTWLAFKNRGDLNILVEGDKRLFNQYGVMLVNPERFPSVKKELGQSFVDWVTSPEGQQAIADYKINGEQLFYPNANQPGA
jgi:tungstate transport system substrate-binding protein